MDAADGDEVTLRQLRKSMGKSCDQGKGQEQRDSLHLRKLISVLLQHRQHGS